jgi:hypothetical protein
MLVEPYDVEGLSPPCEPAAERSAARSSLKAPIAEVILYLNETLRAAVHNPAAGAVSWKKACRNIVFHTYEVPTSNVECIVLA